MSLLEVTLKVYQQSLVRVKALLDDSLLDAVQRVEFRIREHQQKSGRSPSMAVDFSAWSSPGSGKNVLEAVYLGY